MDYLKQACELYELEDKEHYSGETFKIAISLFLRNKKYDNIKSFFFWYLLTYLLGLLTQLSYLRIKPECLENLIKLMIFTNVIWALLLFISIVTMQWLLARNTHNSLSMHLLLSSIFYYFIIIISIVYYYILIILFSGSLLSQCHKKE